MRVTVTLMIHNTFNINVSPPIICRVLRRHEKVRQVALQRFHSTVWVNETGCDNRTHIRKCSDPLSRVRLNAVTSENMKNYFTLREKTLIKKDLLDKPHLIYNMDESGMPLDPKQLKRVAGKGMCTNPYGYVEIKCPYTSRDVQRISGALRNPGSVVCLRGDPVPIINWSLAAAHDV